MVQCCKVEEVLDEEDPRDLHFEEKEGYCALQGATAGSSAPEYNKPLKSKKYNFGIDEKPKMAIIRDYWDEQIVNQVVDLLKEYQDIFPTSFSELKGIVGELGEMQIQLKPYAKPVKKRSYRLNPKYKENVKQELEKILSTGIIITVEELEWISPMIVQDKKTGGIRTCVDMRNLNDTCS